MAKAALWTDTDAEARKRGEQTGLDTLVVHAVNDVCWMLGDLVTHRRNASSTSAEARAANDLN